MMVTFEGVEKRYGRVVALGGVDLQIPEGSITGLVGPNGAGKTTSMLIMSTLLGRDGGEVVVAGHDPQVDPRSVRKIIGYMPDFFGFYDSLTAVEYLEFFAAAQGIAAARRPAVIADLLGLVDLEDKASADVNGLSRGMKQRLALARALIHDPDLLILDEPASGLDPRARIQLRQLIAELARIGKTVLISSHILSELEGICSRLIVIDEGDVKVHGDIADIRRQMSIGRKVVATIPERSIDAAAHLLAAQPEVNDLTVESGLVRFTVAGDDDASADLLRRTVEAGVPVYEWRVDVAGLEELFLQLTGETP